MSEKQEKFNDCECGAKDRDIIIQHVYSTFRHNGDLFVVECRSCHRFKPFVVDRFRDGNTLQQEAIKAWNTRADSKPEHKWEGPIEAYRKTYKTEILGSDYSVFWSGFYAARERKE